MIPALMGKKKAVGLVLSGLKDSPKEGPEEGDGDALKLAAEDLIRAVASKDGSAVADALRAAFACLGNEEI